MRDYSTLFPSFSLLFRLFCSLRLVSNLKPLYLAPAAIMSSVLPAAWLCKRHQLSVHDVFISYRVRLRPSR